MGMLAMGLIIDQPQPMTERLYLERSSRSVRLWNSSRYCRYSRKLMPVSPSSSWWCAPRRRSAARPLPFPLPLPLPFDGRAVVLWRRPALETRALRLVGLMARS